MKFPKGTVQETNEKEMFVLLNLHNKQGKRCLNKVFGHHETELQQMYEYGFEDKSYYLNILNDKKTKYALVVFSLEKGEPEIVFFMTIRKHKGKHWALYDICKQEGYTKGMFAQALSFCFCTSALSPKDSDFYLAVDIDSHHLCTAMSAYIKCGFVPYEIKRHGKERYMCMKYDEKSCHNIMKKIEHNK